LSQRRRVVSILVVARHGAVLDALRTALQSIPEVGVISTATGTEPAAQAIQNGAPDLVLISDQIPAEDIHALIGALGARRPALRVIVMATSLTPGQRFLDSGAFAVITAWDSLARLRAIIRSDLALRVKVDGADRRPTQPHLSPGEAALGGDQGG
jgi:DNA-binding NarL/FixJ family response regulator